jgi:hypothetical protein
LTVKVSKLTQVRPTTATTTTGKAFTDQLKVSGANGKVTYHQLTGALVLTVSSSGKISAPATLVAGTYEATGTARDSHADTGTWSFTLTVEAVLSPQYRQTAMVVQRHKPAGDAPALVGFAWKPVLDLRLGGTSAWLGSPRGSLSETANRSRTLLTLSPS